MFHGELALPLPGGSRQPLNRHLQYYIEPLRLASELQGSNITSQWAVCLSNSARKPQKAKTPLRKSGVSSYKPVTGLPNISWTAFVPVVPTSDLPAGIPNSGPLRWRTLLPGICLSLGWSVFFQRPYITGTVLIAIWRPIWSSFIFNTLQKKELRIILDSVGTYRIFLGNHRNPCSALAIWAVMRAPSSQQNPPNRRLATTAR